MSIHRALAIPEIRLLVCEPLDRQSLGRSARLSKVWREAAMEVLWKYEVVGLEPILASLPRRTYEWDCRVVRIDRRTVASVDIRFALDSQQLRTMLERTSMIRHLSFDIRRCITDQAIYRKLARLVQLHGLGSLFGSLRSISVTTPNPYTPAIVPCHIPVLAASVRGRLPLIPHVSSLVATFPSVATIFIGNKDHRSVAHPRALYVDELPANLLLAVLRTRSSWDIDELHVQPSDVTHTELHDLFMAIAQRCASLVHLSVTVTSFAPEEDELWPLTLAVLRTLSPLGKLTHCDIEAPMRSSLTDADWGAVASAWPLLQSLRVVPRTPWPRPYTTASSSIPACSMHAVLDIVARCPRLVTLALPGVDCRAVPTSAYTPDGSRKGASFPLRKLTVYDSPVEQPEAVGSFLCSVFPVLKSLAYGHWPCPYRVWTLKGGRMVEVPGVRKGMHLDRWDIVRWIVTSRWNETQRLYYHVEPST